MAGMQPDIEISDLCRQEGVNLTKFYIWKKQVMGSAKAIFDQSKIKPNTAEILNEAELQQLKNVIAEITAENVGHKKGLLGQRNMANCPWNCNNVFIISQNPQSSTSDE